MLGTRLLQWMVLLAIVAEAWRFMDGLEVMMLVPTYLINLLRTVRKPSLTTFHDAVSYYVPHSIGIL